MIDAEILDDEFRQELQHKLNEYVASAIAAEPPIVSLRRLVEATGGPATLVVGHATAELDGDTLTLSTIGPDPVEDMAAVLWGSLSKVIRSREWSSDEVRMELKVHGVSRLQPSSA